VASVRYSGAAPYVAASEPATPVQRCVVSTPKLRELSGLAADGQWMYAVSDGGDRLQVLMLRPDCSVERVITNQVDPYDVEDLARGKDGTLWLADTGDNQRRRESVALHTLDGEGRAKLYRLTYPDGPHDAEALLLDRNDRPYIVTKEPFGASGIYRPVGDLRPDADNRLTQIGSITIDRTKTPGGPEKAGGLASVLITGGAVSHDGKVVALRTYTDAYLFSAPDGDVERALKGKPTRIPLPDEPQGEAIAFEPNGALLSGSEGLAPIMVVDNAVTLAPEEAGGSVPDNTARTPEAASESRLAGWQSLGLAGVATLVVLVVVRGLRRVRR
jgi:hypothetical protein